MSQEQQDPPPAAPTQTPPATQAADLHPDPRPDLDAGPVETQRLPAADPVAALDARYGVPGLPMNRGHPFYVGFMGAIGVLSAWFLLGLLGRLTSVVTLIVVALFLAIGLDPVVAMLQRRGLPRGAAVAIVFVGVIALVVGFGAAIVPTLIDQSAELTRALPDKVTALENSELVRRLDAQFHVVESLQTEVDRRISNGETVIQLFGGVFGAGQLVISSVFNTFTVLVLTLYFTASLARLKAAAYSLVPASRRPRVVLLGDEILRRIGGYILGQLGVATINATFTYIGLLVLGLPYPLFLAIVVGILGLIPLVGATLGAVLITLIALYNGGWTVALIVVVYYLVYQQIENYVIAPRIMSRTVDVPGFVSVVAVIAGGALLGVLGALIAIPTAAGLLLIVREVVIPRQARH